MKTSRITKVEQARRLRIRKIVWRDFSFLVAGLCCFSVMSFVELHASEVEMRAEDVQAAPSGIIDTGFIATRSIHQFLQENRWWNDCLAVLNSFALFVPGVYVAYVTLWMGDYDLAFRYLATHLLRSVCGWCTYLPPPPDYLMSFYDFPDIVHCLAQPCGDPSQAKEILPFVTFFSGHVSTMVIAANHMYLHGHQTWGVICHLLNILQMVRLLATRGHYSIDLIIGWFVAVYVSNPAGRLGRYYSKGSHLLPASPIEAFESLTGVTDVRNEARLSYMMRKKELKDALMDMNDDDRQVLLESVSETTATLAAQVAAEAAGLNLERNNDSKNKEE